MFYFVLGALRAHFAVLWLLYVFKYVVAMNFCFDANREGQRLNASYILQHLHVKTGYECILTCVLQDECCRSVNYRKNDIFDEKKNCELLHVTAVEKRDLLIQNPGYDHYILQQPVREYNQTLCEAKRADMVYSSCLQVLEENSEAANGVYPIKTYTSSNFTHVYCHMTLLPGCSGGGWTMVMKLDGSKETFSYSSSYWMNMESYRLENGRTGLDKNETKLPTYWSTSFNELCIGMKIDNALRFIQLNYTAASLYDVLARGVFHSTNIPRETWKSLYHSSSLQKYCGNQGFNVAGANPEHARVRIGIIGNNEDDCVSPDSFIGFGANGGKYRRYCHIMHITNSCGNSAYCSADNGNKEIRAMGYIFVR